MSTTSATPIEGQVEEGWGKVADAFRANFEGKPGDEVAAPFTMEEMTAEMIETTGLDRDTIIAWMNAVWGLDSVQARAGELGGALDPMSDYMSTRAYRAASLGHPGSGESVGFADPHARVGFGYVMNLSSFRIGEPRASSLAAAVTDCFG